MPHTWKLECLELYNINRAKTETFIKDLMELWKSTLQAKSKWIVQVNIKCIYQGHALSPQVLCIGLTPLSQIIRGLKLYKRVSETLTEWDKDAPETVKPITAGCEMRVCRKYLERPKQVVSIVYRNICAEYELEFLRSKWDFQIKTNKMVTGYCGGRQARSGRFCHPKWKQHPEEGTRDAREIPKAERSWKGCGV